MATAALAATLGVCLGNAHSARADEPLFGYVYATDILPKGQSEIEQWSTLREGRSQGDFHLWQGRTEYSYGLTNNLQLSGYVNYDYANVYHNAPDGTTVPPEVFADYTADPDARFEKWRFEGVSAEAIWRVLSPYTAPVGIALYVEPTIGPRTREVENRLIIQKNFYDDRIVLAFNFTWALELRKLQGDPEAEPGSRDARIHWDRETDINFGLAASYRFAANWSAGLEFLNEREFASLNPFKGGVANNVAYYFGPNIHYGGRRFFVTATFLFQLPWAKDYANPPPGFIVHGITNADDFEKYRLRIKAGFYF
ncbi:MAG: hypothetical protein GC201_03030 [Alphaproteobacteria bacterium]|nr:hypothetical protein [Alphaproteobacteria bacterium]